MKGEEIDERPRPKRLPPEARRAEFIQRAITFFAEEGFDSSTRELARRLGVSQPLLYRYFPSKDDLVQEVYQAVYVDRWRSTWSATLADRSRPLADRLAEFYRDYKSVIFNRDWMRIYLFAGLRGVDINSRYMLRVRSRILEPIVREANAEAGQPDRAASDVDIELAWVIHGGIFYYGVRRHIYATAALEDEGVVIDASIDALLCGLDRLRRA